jgi:hypothetical protein
MQNRSTRTHEKKLQIQINLLTTTNEMLAEKLAAADDVLAVYAIAVSNLTAERDAQSKAADHWMTEANKAHNSGVRLEAERDALLLDVNAERGRKTIWQQQYEAAIEQRDALAERVKKLEADAGRYRWLRNQSTDWRQIGATTPYVVRGQIMDVLYERNLDAAIDAAIKGATNE